ncbi:trypsin-like serine protease [Streptomyces sp. NPDC000594]|uniref:trypsin-like serine protease n=1 Tax=Streptomyces sp. NPDC000594 TaxID=3154261 RepID=UPI003321F559
MAPSARTRRIRYEIPAVATVLALAGAALATGGVADAEAATPAGAPQGSAQPAPAPQGELRERIAGALDALERAKAPARPGPGADRKRGPSARIIGGKTTVISSAPWMAQLYFEDDRGVPFFCGGAVVAPTKIVTAAHCVDGIDWKGTGAVVTGADRTPTQTGRKDAAGRPVLDLHGGQLRGAVRQWQHRAYDDWTLNNDVAVLTLDATVKAKPLPILRGGDSGLYKAGTDGKVYGWGLTGSGPTAKGSDRLKVADADAQSDANCRKAYGSDFVAGTMYCAGKAPTGKDSTSETTCNGDSGGPLVAGGKLAGIVSWGDADCSAKGKYGVYAKVSAFQVGLRAQLHDTNWNRDRYADLVARRGSTAHAWTTAKKGTSLTRKESLGAFTGVDLLLQADLDRDDRQDLIWREKSGEIRWKRGGGATTTIVKNWRDQRQIVAPGDLGGDEIPDLLTVSAKGNAYVHKGTGKGTFAAPVLVGSGWDQFDTVRGRGDLSGDGRADVLSRGAGGRTYLHQGTGDAKKPFRDKVQVGTYSHLNALVTTGDVSGDGRADMIGRDSAGKLWLYPGTGKAAKPFGTRIQLAGGWQDATLLG